ncbi:MAG: MtrB/PioB family decaheme-associated outer membrane protein [Azonexus sp.]
MKTHNEKLQLSVLSLAVQGALVAMLAAPALALAVDDEVAALTRPTASLEVGAAHVSEKSAKFGEYNGLPDSGAVFIGNFSLGGGSAYDAYDGGNGTLRWNVNGRDLGTTSREVGGSVSDQGRWDLNFGYDELRHNISDSYQTPQQGSMGGNRFTMPANFGTVNAQTGLSTRSLDALQRAAFHTEDVGSTRRNTSFGAGFHFSRQLSIRFDYNHLDQTGAKLIGTGAQGLQATPYGGTTNTWRAEANNILMNPTKYTTDTFNMAINWVGEKGFLTGGYFGSIFRDSYNSLSWENALVSSNTTLCPSGGSCTYQTNTMSTAPSNSFHQLNLSGGYAFSPSTKLAGGLSYGHGSQDSSYLNDLMQAGLPQTSLDGSVVTTHANLKLSNQTSKDLLLSAGVKYNERDNRTSSNTYNYLAQNGAAYTGVNTPYSNRKTQFEVAADYRLSKAQNLRLAYEHEAIKRWCNNVVGGAQCVASPSSDEDRLGLNYRLKLGDTVKLNAGYTFAKRNAEFDHNYLANTGNYAVTVPVVLAGNNHTALNGGDYTGFVAYPYASREQNIVKAGVSWQATDKLELGLAGRFSKDRYDADLGVQNGQSASVNLDATYSYTENASVSAYLSWQQSDRDLRAQAASLATNIWTNKLNNDSSSIGLNTRHALLGGKLELLGDLAYSLDKSRYSTQVPYLATCGATGTLTCGDTPDIKSELVTLKLTGSYKLDKHSRVAVVYLYQNLKTSDYYYNGYQYGFTPNRVMPTNEQAPNYNVNFLGVSYAYSFQ